MSYVACGKRWIAPKHDSGCTWHANGRRHRCGEIAGHSRSCRCTCNAVMRSPLWEQITRERHPNETDPPRAR